MIETTAVVALSAAKLISAGFCLSIGFWAGKKLTNKLDTALFLYDKKEIDRLSKEMNLERT